MILFFQIYLCTILELNIHSFMTFTLSTAFSPLTSINKEKSVTTGGYPVLLAMRVLQ